MQALRRLLYSTLGLKGYLTFVRNSFFLAYKNGLLKNKAEYKWHHFVPNIIQQGDTIIDIGANLGYFSDIFCKLAGKTGKVYSVEPVQPFREQLQLQLRNAGNNEIIGSALGAENLDEIVLGIPEEVRQLGYIRTGLPSILHGGTAKPDGVNTFGASLKKGSELFSKLTKIDYIKCDIEGYETIVFDEMKHLIAEKKPIVQVETWGEQLDVIVTLFQSLEFKGFKLYDGKLIPLNEVPKDAWGKDDTLFVPEEKMYRIEKFLK
jgi:FkbM family methyltransferase